MKLFHLFNKFLLRTKTEGFKETLCEFIYFNRIMVAIEKYIIAHPSILTDSMHTIIIDRNNYKKYQEKYNIKSVTFFCKHGAQCFMAFDGNTCLGYQLWTTSNNFSDLKKLNIKMEDNEAYLFDLFVFPEFRGTDTHKVITIETHNYLLSQGINKIYGFFFQDNIKALWWHRTYLKCKEIKRVPTHRFLIFELTNGKILLNL